MSQKSKNYSFSMARENSDFFTKCCKAFGGEPARWYGGIGSCVNFVKFSMSPNRLFGVSILNLIYGGTQVSIIFYAMLQFGPGKRPYFHGLLELP